LQALAGLVTLVTSLDLSVHTRVEVSDDGFRALACLTVFTSLNLEYCQQGDISADDWMRAISGLTALTNLDFTYCENVSDDGLHALAGLRALTSLN
jgi:hypothetical protein